MSDHDTRLWEEGEKALFPEPSTGFKYRKIPTLEPKMKKCINCKKESLDSHLGYWCSETCLNLYLDKF